MEIRRFDGVVRSFGDVRSRRGLLGGLMAAAPLALPGADAAKHKKRHKKPNQAGADCPVCPEPPICPSPPAPPPAPFCAGKNDCAQTGNVTCQASGEECRCVIRQDNATSFCGTTARTTVSHCSDCAPGEVCIMLGGECVSGFGCSTPCPNPL